MEQKKTVSHRTEKEEDFNKMALNVAGLVVLVCFYVLILIVGLLAARWKMKGTSNRIEASLVADRDINMVVGVLTMSATLVGGGFINGSAESVAMDGLVWTLAPFGICIGLITGGLVYAKPMREKRYLTMLDPIYEKSGNVTVFLVYLASLCGDLFWTASILSALGTSLSVILDINLTVAIVTSAAVTVFYTMFGQMISVAYTDVVQLAFLTSGLVLSVPFVLTNDNVGSIEVSSTNWLGKVEKKQIGFWIDLAIAMICGTIPWQSYFQRVLSVRSSHQAQIFSVIAGLMALVLVTPSVLIGAAARSANWNSTSLGASPMDLDISSMVLPHVLKEFTPSAVSIIGLGAISAAVMSSMDSSILGSGSMFSHNIYRHIFRKLASEQELLWIHRLAVFCVGAIATVIALYVKVIYGMFILAADIVFVIVLPQLSCALFFKYTNAYGAIPGYFVGLILRLGGGEYFLNFDYFIKYPLYDDEMGQLFPFRTFAAVLSTISVVVISSIAHAVFSKGILGRKRDLLSSFDTSSKYNISNSERKEIKSHDNDDSFVYGSKDTALTFVGH